MEKIKAICAIIINDKDEILLIKRGREPFVGYWSLISGTGESKKGIEPEKGVIEEVNCDLQTTSFKGKHAFSIPVENDDLVDEIVVFVGKVNESEIKVRDHFALEYKWFSPNEIKTLGQLAFEHNTIIEYYLAKNNGPNS